jgi:hypothetical protein
LSLTHCRRPGGQIGWFDALGRENLYAALRVLGRRFERLALFPDNETRINYPFYLLGWSCLRLWLGRFRLHRSSIRQVGKVGNGQMVGLTGGSQGFSE